MKQIQAGEDYPLEERLDRLNLLRRSPILFSLSDEHLQHLTRTLINLTCKRGVQVLVQDRNPKIPYFFIVRQGRCRMVYQTSPGNGVTIAWLSAGNCFGEGMALGETASNTTIIADEDCQLLAATRRNLEEVLGKESLLWKALDTLREQRQRLIDGVKQALDTTMKGVGKTVVIFSPKGGSGKSTLAINLAASLNQAHPGEVVLMDLALPFNHVAVMTGLTPSSGLAQVDPELDDVTFEEEVLVTVVRHGDGLRVLPAALRAEDADLLSAELVTRTLQVLKVNFRYVIVDTSSSMPEQVLSMLDEANFILLLGSYEVASVKNLTEVLRLFEQLKIVPARVCLVLSHRDSKTALSSKMIEQTLGWSARSYELPFVPDLLLETLNIKGEVLTHKEPRHGYAKAVGDIAKLIESGPGKI